MSGVPYLNRELVDLLSHLAHKVEAIDQYVTGFAEGGNHVCSAVESIQLHIGMDDGTYVLRIEDTWCEIEYQASYPPAPSSVLDEGNTAAINDHQDRGEPS